jgi:hypothetical protein
MTATHTPSEVIEVPDFVAMTEPGSEQTMAELAAALVALFVEDESLPQPRYLSLSVSGQEINMQFGQDAATFHDLARWAGRFGGTVTGSNVEDVDGKPAVRCEVKFPYAGVQVKAYAYVRTSSNR